MLSVGFSRRRALDLPEFSQIARTQRTRAPVAACLAEHPPLPPRARRGQAFRGPGFRNGSPTRINLHHCLACRRCCGDTSFVSSLLHQFVTSLTGPGASPPSYSPTPLELRIMRNPQCRHRPISLRWPGPFREPSGVSVQTQVQPSRAAPAHASVHGIDLSAKPGFHRRSGVPPGPACPRRPIPAEAGSWGMESAGEGCSPSFRIWVAAIKPSGLIDTTTRAPLFAAPALLNARGFRSPPLVEMSGGRARMRFEL